MTRYRNLTGTYFVNRSVDFECCMV